MVTNIKYHDLVRLVSTKPKLTPARDAVWNTSVSMELDSNNHIPNSGINRTSQCRSVIQLYFVDVFSWIKYKVMDILRWMVSF